MTPEPNDIENWSIDQPSEAEYEAYAASKPRSNKRRVLITIVVLALCAATFVGGFFLANRPGDSDTAASTSSTSTTIAEPTNPLDALTNDMAGRVAGTSTEPYLIVQLANHEVSVAGRVSNAAEQEAVVGLLQSAFSSRLEADAIAVNDSIDQAVWIDELTGRLDVLQRQPVLSGGIGVNNSDLIINVTVPTESASEIVADSFSETQLALTDEIEINDQPSSASITLSRSNGLVEATGVIPSESLSAQLEAAIGAAYGDDERQVDMTIDEATYASLDFAQLGEYITAAVFFESHSIEATETTLALEIPADDFFQEDGVSLTGPARTFIQVLVENSDIDISQVAVAASSTEQLEIVEQRLIDAGVSSVGLSETDNSNLTFQLQLDRS